jgi:hypothetical protein
MWGCVYMMFLRMRQVFRTTWQCSPILYTGSDGNLLAPKLQFYDVPKNEATVPDPLAVFSDTVHWPQQQCTCA